MAIMQKEGLRGNESYPKNKEEIAGARKNVVKMMHMEAVHDSVAKLLQQPPEKAFPNLARLIAQVIGKVIGAIKAKHGSKVHVKLIIMLAKLAMSEINLISKGIGLGEIPKQASAQIVAQAGNMLDETLAKKPGQQPGQPQQPGPQMQPGGQPQGQPTQTGGQLAPQQGLLGG